MNETYKIEKGVPLPPTSWLRLIIGKLEVGDSFTCDDKGGNRTNSYTAASVAGYKLSIRKQLDGTIRIWRVK